VIALRQVALFAVLGRAGTGEDCDEHRFATPLALSWPRDLAP